MHPRIVLLAAGAATAGMLHVTGRRRKSRGTDSYQAHAEQVLGQQLQQRQQPLHASAAAVGQQPAWGSESCSQPTGRSIKRTRALLFLLLSLALALAASATLASRGQHEAAAAVAITWLLTASVMLIPVLQLSSSPAAAAAAQAEPAGSEDGVDATMVVTELMEPPVKALSVFNGTWIKDAAASDSMEAAMRLIRLNAVMRQAVKLIRGVQLGIEEERFRFAVFSAISWFKLSEFYPWSGTVCHNRRRDMRRGVSYGRVSISSSGTRGPTIQLHYTWDAPHSGRATDEFSIDAQGRLQLHTVVTVGAEMASYTQVYRRKGAAGAA